MIGVIFQFGNDVVETRVEGKVVLFRSASSGKGFVTIDNLYISKEGVVKEFPDLKDNEFWRVEAIKRFKEKVNAMKSESEISDYLIEDLKKHGYVPKYRQKSGFRPEVINGS